jgi:outer membrane protein assembly factor BamB
MYRCLVLACVGAFVAVLAISAAAPAQEWTRFRGPNGSGISLAAGIPTAWTEKDLRWKVRLAGIGHSSPVLWGQKIFVTSGDSASGKRVVQCLDTTRGKELWSRNFAAEKHRTHEHNSWASATPAVDDRHVYLLWASPKDYLVVALAHDGEEKWRRDLGGFQSGHGFGVSPIVFEDLVIVANEQDGKSSLLALDRDTGKTRWRAPRKSRTTYATPCVFAPRGRPPEIIFANYEHGITSIDPETGAANWEADVFDKRHMETSIASPIVAGDLVIGLSGWLGVRKEVIALRPERDGRAPKQLYNLTKGTPLVPTPLAKDDLLFLWGDDGVVSCFGVATGKEHWRERVPGSYYSSAICVGLHLYNVSREGEVIVLKASREFQQVAVNRLGEGSHSSPAVAGGTLYFRTFQHLSAVRPKRYAE